METPIINSSRMEEIRRRRKQKNRKILLSLAAGVVVLAAAVAVLVWALNRPQEEPLPSGPRLEEALAGGSTQGWRYRVSGGLSAHQAQCPLPCYTFSPPEGYTQVLNAREDANALSDSHTDLYSTLGAEYFDRWDPDNFDPIWDLEYGHWFESGDSALPEGAAESRIRFDQQFAMNGVTVEFAAGVTPYRLKLGEMVVYYGSNEQGTQIYWVYQDSLLSLATTEILNQQEIMDWVDRQVDYTGAEPVYSPLELVRGESYEQYAAQHPGETGYNPQVFHVQGNPQLPEDIAPYDFATPPEGFAKINPSGEEALSPPAPLQDYSSS